MLVVFHGSQRTSFRFDIDWQNSVALPDQKFEFRIILPFPIEEIDSIAGKLAGDIVLIENAHAVIDAIKEVRHVDSTLISKEAGIEEIDAIIAPIIFF